MALSTALGAVARRMAPGVWPCLQPHLSEGGCLPMNHPMR